MTVKLPLLFLLAAVLIAESLFAQPTAPQHHALPLDGIWRFKLDPFETGMSSNGVQLLPQLSETITLPGSTDQAGKGIKTQSTTSLRLTRPFEYKGVAWYEKEIDVPAEWKGKDVIVFLERAHWETTLWINNKLIGRRESLSVPHEYDVSALIEPGRKNKIRVRVSNEHIYKLEYAHAITEETQTNWNGIIGKMELQAYDKVRIADVQLYPDIEKKLSKAVVTIKNSTKKPVKGKLSFAAAVVGGASMAASHQTAFSSGDSIFIVTTDIPLGHGLKLWDEFTPNLYALEVQLRGGSDQVGYEDVKSLNFGLRQIGTRGTGLIINERPAFIRATVNCAEFPLTGYPPTDKEEWLRILKTCKEYGLNAVRFHSWCPPKAAFEAADELGIYLQVENPDWRFTVGADTAVNRFLRDEAERILRIYGNHPSFMMFCEGNEMVGPKVKEFLAAQVSHWKAIDPRRLYTGSAAYPLISENQFHVLYGARPHRWKEGMTSRFNARPLDTKYDYSDYVKKNNVPIITHEIGQWCVYPNFKEIKKYTGVLKPYNYELFRELLRDHHMLDQADQFMMASGKFQVIQKKEEVESYIRTPDFGGYHMLQLNDFPGQGTAPVGVVDIFWDPKPYVSAKEFRQFQAERVPLLRTNTFTWTNNQVFKATAQFANYGQSTMHQTVVDWFLKYPDGRVYAAGNFGPQDIPVGNPHTLGELSLPLTEIKDAAQMELSLVARGTNYANHWNLWVYPASLPGTKPKNVMVAYNWDAKVSNFVKKGGTVLLLADTAKIESDADPAFSGISWNTVWSGMPPNMLGILCDPKHPSLQHFPTEYHSNWQWWDIVRSSKPMILEHMPLSLKPLVQMVPDWNNPRKIALFFEAKVGKGSLLVSGVDLKSNLDKRPVARQMLHSLKEYVASRRFSPSTEVSVEMVDKIFKRNK